MVWFIGQHRAEKDCPEPFRLLKKDDFRSPLGSLADLGAALLVFNSGTTVNLFKYFLVTPCIDVKVDAGYPCRQTHFL
jgi:hypothetical protein